MHAVYVIHNIIMSFFKKILIELQLQVHNFCSKVAFSSDEEFDSGGSGTKNCANDKDQK